MLAWAEHALVIADTDAQTEIAPSREETTDPLGLTHGARRYRAVELRREEGRGASFGLLALGFDGPFVIPAPEIVNTIAAELWRHAHPPA